MKAVRFYGIKDVRVEDIAPVEPTPEQALVKIIYGGICGSDLHIYSEGMFVENFPETMGHEFIGRVVSTPENSRINEGDIVVGDPRVACNKCIACETGKYDQCSELGFIGEVSPGAFAEYLAIRPEKLIKLSDNVDIRQGALVEPLAVAVHACHNIMTFHPKQVLVAGAGPIGLLIAYLLKAQYGVNKVAVADIDESRLKKASSTGADELINSIADTNGEYDYIVDAVGSPNLFNTLLDVIKFGGCISISAIYERLPTFDVNMLVGKELTINGNNAYSFEDLEEAAQIISSGKYDFSWLVTSVLSIEKASDAFPILLGKEKSDLKILIDFNR